MGPCPARPSRAEGRLESLHHRVRLCELFPQPATVGIEQPVTGPVRVDELVAIRCPREALEVAVCQHRAADEKVVDGAMPPIR